MLARVSALGLPGGRPMRGVLREAFFLVTLFDTFRSAPTRFLTGRAFLSDVFLVDFAFCLATGIGGDSSSGRSRMSLEGLGVAPKCLTVRELPQIDSPNPPAAPMHLAFVAGHHGRL